MNKRTKRRLLIAVPVLVLLCFAYSAVSIRNYSKHYCETKCDVAIVLGAGTANGKLSRVFEQRVKHAIDLLERKKVDAILFTGGIGEGQCISDAAVAADYARSQGVSPEKILLEEASVITFQNVKNARDIMLREQLSAALIVSDPYHMKRSMEMCKLMGIDARPSPTPTTMYRSRETKYKFLLKETFNYWGYLLVGQHRNVN